jgi:hypothetical protein
VNSSEGVRAAVLNGIGLTIASQWMFAPELASGAIRAVLTEWTLPEVELWMVFPAGRPNLSGNDAPSNSANCGPGQIIQFPLSRFRGYASCQEALAKRRGEAWPAASQ